MTDTEIRGLVKECSLDWQRGYLPLLDDTTNRYAVLVRKVETHSLLEVCQECQYKQNVIESLIDELQLQLEYRRKHVSERENNNAKATDLSQPQIHRNKHP